jgi:hypothetical protein
MKDVKSIYEEVNAFFIKSSEEENIPISPTLGRGNNIVAMPLIYHEIHYDRIMSIQIQDEIDSYETCPLDYWSSNFHNYMGLVLPLLTIDLKDIRFDCRKFWPIRKLWFHDRSDEDVLAKELDLISSREFRGHNT